MAIYLVTGPDEKERLVEAANRAGARNHAARTAYDVRVASQADLFRLAKAGGDIEIAGAEPEAEPETQQPEVVKDMALKDGAASEDTGKKGK